MITIDYPHGNRLVRHVGACTDDDLALVQPFTDELHELAAELGIAVDDLTLQIVMLLVETEHEDEMYRRACDRRGVLPL
jgi:predicted metalloenzyme YecM